MGALAKLQARIHELEKLNEQLSVWKPREKLSRTLELSNLVSRFNALAEAKVSIKFELAPISGTVSLIMNAMMLFEVSLLHAARTGCEFYRKKGEKGDAEEAAVMAEFRTALLTREADPVEITLTVDDGAATPVLDAEAALLAELPARPPREVTVRVTQPRAAEALAAPRAALVIVEPDKACRLFPLDARALATPVAEFLMTALFGEADAGDERDTLLRELRQTIVVSAAHVKNADATPAGRARRTQLITTFRSGKFGLASSKLVRTDATLADATDAAPLVVLHAIARVDAPCATHVTLTLRDHAMDVQLSDALLPHGAFPLTFQKMLNEFIEAAEASSSAGARGTFSRETALPLLNWISSSTMIQVSVNGGAPERIYTGLETIAAPEGAPQDVTRVAVDVVVPLLPTPGERTPGQKFWLEPELPPLVAASVAALEAGEDHPSKPWKKLEVLRKLGVDVAKVELEWLGVLIALGTFPRPSPVAAGVEDSYIQTLNTLLSLRPEQHLDHSRACRRFLDEHCGGRDPGAQRDALRLLATKRFSLIVNGPRTHLSLNLVKLVLDNAGKSPHPHAVTTVLIFAYWVAEAKGVKFTFRGRVHDKPPFDVMAAAFRRKVVEAVLSAGRDDHYADYGAGTDRAKRSLTDLAVLWTAQSDPDARVCYEAAGAAGNALAAAVAARLGTESPATLKKLVRKYRLDAFATNHMETLPDGLARLEAAVLRHAPDDGAAAAPRPKKDKRRAAVSSADAAAVGDSFALEDPGASGTLSKKKQAERDRKARDKEKEEKRRAKRKKADARRREQAEREAAAREEAAREEAAREEAEQAAAAAAPPAPELPVT